MSESLQQLILDTLDAHSTIPDTRSLLVPGKSQPATSNEDQILILGALNSLLSRQVGVDLLYFIRDLISTLQMINYETHETSSYLPSPEGAQIVIEGSHEARVWGALPAVGAGSPVTPVQLKALVGDEAAKVGQGRAFKNGWIGKNGDGLVKLVRPSSFSP